MSIFVLVIHEDRGTWWRCRLKAPQHRGAPPPRTSMPPPDQCLVFCEGKQSTVDHQQQQQQQQQRAEHRCARQVTRHPPAAPPLRTGARTDPDSQRYRQSPPPPDPHPPPPRPGPSGVQYSRPKHRGHSAVNELSWDGGRAGAEAPVIGKCGSPRPCLCTVDVLMNRTTIPVLYVLSLIWISHVEPLRAPPARRSITVNQSCLNLLHFLVIGEDFGHVRRDQAPATPQDRVSGGALAGAATEHG
ncbi:hypothetical protein GWK47_005896 [Chionoecetes opilio]|uniref:Uncharacterized protein n=1 Tax=Chionoecetes opilio TaxID=41210 RepID=A0A8J5CIZ1_CHIOP|nr:hypothetical protein GWK47_005896 [Chionoecetes opilio]